MRKATTLALAVLLAALAAPLVAQITDGNITGTVYDPSGAAVAQAQVELENLATGLKQARQADDTGVYRFNNVPVGNYRITAKAQGFAVKAVGGVKVDLNRTTTVNFTLELSNVATEVVVNEAAAVIDTTTATIANTYSEEESRRLPAMNLASGVLNLALLGGGVAHSGGLGLGEGPSVGGQRPRQNNFMIEGVDNNRKDVTGSNLNPSNEAVKEFTMLQNQFTAEFGRSTGGQFNTVIKSGTNQIHGSLYEYFRNRNLQAQDESFKRQGTYERARYDDNRYGFTVGGPVVKNKLFYFGNWERNSVGQATTPSAATYTPTAAGYNLLSSMAGISKSNLDVLKQYATPSSTASASTTVNGVAIPIGILPIAFPSYTNNYNWLTSIDYNISERDQLRGRYIETRFSGIDPGVSPNLPAFSQPRSISQRLFSVSEFHTFSPSVVNEFRAAYSRYQDDIPAGNFQFPGLDVFPNITIEQDLQIQIGPYDTAPQSGIQNTYQLVNNLTWLRNSHSFKFGFDGRKYIAPTNFIQRVRGDYGYSNLERYLLDLNPDILAERNTGGVPYSGNSLDMYWFAQDEWKIRPNFTLTLGIRHEYKGVPRGDKLQVLNAVSNTPGLIEFREPTARKDYWAPRIGIAYSPGRAGDLVIRSGFGIAYDVYFDNFGTLSKPVQLENTLTVAPTQTIPNFLANGGISPSQRPDQLDETTARAFTSTYIPDPRLPYSIQWNFGVQKVLKNDYTVEARYLGTRGVRLWVQDRPNQMSPITASNSLPTFYQRPSQAELDRLSLTLNSFTNGPTLDFSGLPANIFRPEYVRAGFQVPITAFRNIGNSIYHGLATELSRRYKNGMLFRGAYTWSKVIDDSTADLFSTLVAPRRAQDFQNYQAERARSFLDRTHRFTFSWVYDTQWFNSDSNWFLKNMVGNWNFSGTYTYESPQYATVQSGLDSNLNGDAAGDRVLVNPNGTPGTGSGVTALRNSSNQVVGYLANNPNAQYIVAGAGVYPTGGRGTLPLRPINNFDLNFGKKFNLSERRWFEINASLVNALNHPQYVAGSINTVYPFDSASTRNHLIPGNALFNDPTRVYDSNSRVIFLVGRFIF